MTAQEVIEELKALGKPSIKKVLVKHGACEPFFGVSVEDLKKIQKRIKKDHGLAMELYDTGISDAMYLAGLIVEDARMTKKDLNRWVKSAYWAMLSESTVPWVASEGPHGWEMGLEWIESETETIAAAGWSTLGAVLKLKPDAELDLAKIGELLDRVAGTIHDQPDRVLLQMNGFVIDAGSYVTALTDRALEVADRMGLVKVNMGETRVRSLVRVSISRRSRRTGSSARRGRRSSAELRRAPPLVRASEAEARPHEKAPEPPLRSLTYAPGAPKRRPSMSSSTMRRAWSGPTS